MGNGPFLIPPVILLFDPSLDEGVWVDQAAANLQQQPKNVEISSPCGLVKTCISVWIRRVDPIFMQTALRGCPKDIFNSLKVHRLLREGN